MVHISSLGVSRVYTYMGSSDWFAMMTFENTSPSHVVDIVNVENKHKIVKICIVFMTLCFGCYSIMKSQNEIFGLDIGYALSCPLYSDFGLTFCI